MHFKIGTIRKKALETGPLNTNQHSFYTICSKGQWDRLENGLGKNLSVAAMDTRARTLRSAMMM